MSAPKPVHPEGCEIESSASGGMTFAGPSAVDVFAATSLACALRTYGRSGLRVYRHPLRVLFAQAQGYTGKTYRRSRAEAARAAEDVTAWARDAAAQIPKTWRPA